ncbi:unnamed protein product [Chrysoparadoxa australica]
MHMSPAALGALSLACACGVAKSFQLPTAPRLLSPLPASRSGVDEVDRRRFLAEASAVAAAGLISSLALPVAVNAAESKVILITGSNSGIGKDAAAKLATMGHEVHLLCRTAAKAQLAKEETGAAGAFECDLSSLGSVRAFAKQWGDRPVDVLCLNAGVAPATKGEPAFTREGYEVAIGTNHLGHFLLSSLLINSLEKTSLPKAKLVVTASSVHDPDTPGGDVGSPAGLGDLAGLVQAVKTGQGFEMVDGSAYDGDKAYKDSKLCNVLFTREAERRLRKKRSKVEASCFSPGLITSTGLFRNQSPLFSSLFGFAATNLLKVAASVSQGGDTLVEMATSEPKGGAFLATQPGKPGSAFEVREVSKEAQDTQKGEKLWQLSSELVGLGGKGI